jgi:hypothetical protein
VIGGLSKHILDHLSPHLQFKLQIFRRQDLKFTMNIIVCGR